MNGTERDLDGRVAVVSEGGRGVGAAISLSMAGRGAHVVVGFSGDSASAENTCAGIEAHRVKAIPFEAQMHDPDQVSALFERVAESFGRLDVFVSNATSIPVGSVLELDAGSWESAMGTNARSLLLGSQLAHPLMTNGGAIVALTRAWRNKDLGAYAGLDAAQAALMAVVRNLAVEFAGDGIRVNAVGAGVSETDELSQLPTGEEMVAWQEGSPLGRLVTPDDIAGCVDFLTSDASSMITGQRITADGGGSIR